MLIPILEDDVNTEDLTRYEMAFQKTPTIKSKFDYSLCLLRSPLKSDMLRAINLLEELRLNDKGCRDRDYLYHLAIVHTRLKQFEDANRYVVELLRTEPNNSQVITLETIIRQKKFQQTVSDVVSMTVFSSIIVLTIWYFRIRGRT